MKVPLIFWFWLSIEMAFGQPSLQLDSLLRETSSEKIQSVSVESNLILEESIGQFGLRFQPIQDQNVYLTYTLGNIKKRTCAEIGLSLNNLSAMTFSICHRLKLN